MLSFCFVFVFSLLFHKKIFSIFSVLEQLIFKATHRKAVSSVEVEHVGIGAVEVEAARTGTTNRTAPTSTVGTDTVERTTADAADARHGQFKRGGKSTHRCIYSPT